MTEQVKTETGLKAISAMFASAAADRRAAFLPYFPIGYPDFETSLDIVCALAEAGADGFEIGIPFSDPLADGPTIQSATQVALQNGVTPAMCLDAVHTLLDRGMRQPMLLMSYLNPLLAYRLETFIADAGAAGADGLIVPDLPPEEAGELSRLCVEAGLGLIFFLAPTSDEERIRLVAQRASGFIYLVSVTGVTGARGDLPTDLSEFVRRVRVHTKSTPLVMGFGISTSHQVKSMHGLVDGYIVGSALVKEAGNGLEGIRKLAASLRA
jgi:tryptophan synthase alpha chain